MEERFVKPRSPVVLFFVGAFFGPIFSMLWLGKWRYAALYAVTPIVAITLILFLTIFGVIDPVVIPELPPLSGIDSVFIVYAVIGLVHAFSVNKLPCHRPLYSSWYVAILIAVIIPLAIISCIRTYLYQPFDIPSESNVPSLMSGDYVWVSKSTYNEITSPQRGDLAVFKLPRDLSIDYVKRVVGLPGDRIKMIAGVLHINDVPVQLEEATLSPSFYKQSEIKYFRETLPGGRSYVIANIQNNGTGDNTEEYVVPDGHYFTLGDNRDNSADSRFLDPVGYIPRENFVGPVVARFWNGLGLSLVNRPEEIYPKP